MSIGCSGLNTIMAQAVLDIRKTFSGQEHIDCATVTKAMNRIDVFKAFRTQGFLKIFFTDSVNTVSSKFCSALIDEQAMLIKRFGFNAVLVDITSDELNSSLFQFYSSIAITFTQDDQSTVLGVEVIEVKCCDFTGPSAGVLKQMKDGVITKAILFDEIDAMKDFQGFIRIRYACIFASSFE